MKKIQIIVLFLGAIDIITKKVHNDGLSSVKGVCGSEIKSSETFQFSNGTVFCVVL